MSKHSSFDRFIAPQFSEEDKQEMLEEAGKRKMAEGGARHEQEQEKTPVQIETCLLMDELTNRLRQKYGLEPLAVPAQNIHIIDLPLNRGEIEIGGLFSAKTQSVIVRPARSKTEFADYVCHELIHFKSHGAIQVPTEGDELDFGYRGGFTTNSRDGKSTYYSMLDEGLTEELSKRTVEELKRNRHSLVADEAEETSKVQAEYGKKNGEVGEFFSKDLLWAKYLDENDPRRAEYRVTGFEYAYTEQRDVLYMLVDKLYAKNAGQFTDKEQVFDLFFKGKMQGNFLSIAKLIDKTFGKGTFRKIGELSGSAKTMEEYKEFVESL